MVKLQNIGLMPEGKICMTDILYFGLLNTFLAAGALRRARILSW